jgi:hypothetical protein
MHKVILAAAVAVHSAFRQRELTPDVASSWFGRVL